MTIARDGSIEVSDRGRSGGGGGGAAGGGDGVGGVNDVTVDISVSGQSNCHRRVTVI